MIRQPGLPAIGMIVLLLSAVCPAAAIAADPLPQARIEIQDAPFTRNQLVHLVVVPDPIDTPNQVLEVRLSNDPTTSNGLLANATTTPESTDWQLGSGPDGLRTVYAQLRFAGGWSPVGSATITLDQSPGSSIAFEIDELPGFWDATTSAPEPDWRERSSTPTDRIFASGPGASSPDESRFTIGDPKWGLVFYHEGPSIAAGPYDSVPTDYTGDCATTCVTITRTSGSCSGTGPFVIDDIAFTAEGDLERLDADFRLECGVSGVMAGSIRYGSARGIVAIDQTPERYVFEQGIVNETAVDRSVTFRNIGTAPATLGQATATGDAAGDYEIRSDSCSGHALAASASCSVTVRFAATTEGYRFAALDLPDDSSRAGRHVRLLGYAWRRVTLDLSVAPPDAGPGLATVDVTRTPGNVDPPALFLDGGQVFGGGETVESTPTRRIDRFQVMVTPGHHEFEARFQGGGFFLYPDPAVVAVDVSDSGQTWGFVSLGSSAYTTSRDVHVTTMLNAGMPNLGVVALSNDGIHWTEFVNFSEPKAWTLSSGDGVKTVYARWSDPSGVGWSPISSDTIILDTVVPTAAAPVSTLAFSTAMTVGHVPVHLAWSGSDAGSGIDHYELAQRIDGGIWVPGTLVGTSTTRSVYGHTYQFAVRAIDKAGNVGGWSYGSTFTVRGISEAAASVHDHGTWATSTSTTWWGGTAKSSSKAGSTVSCAFTGRSIAWVGLKAPNRGKANVYVNGVLKATVDLSSATTRKQLVVWSANYSTSATRTVTIKVLGTSGRPRVDVDGFIVGS